MIEFYDMSNVRDLRKFSAWENKMGIRHEEFVFPWLPVKRETNREIANRYVKKVIFNPPATIVFFADGTKTVVKCQNGEKFDEEKGLAMAIIKHDIGLGIFYKVFENAERRYSEEDEK